MHEVSLCESIMDILTEQARQAGAEKVLSVKLVIGEMSGVVEGAMRFAFEVVSRGSVAEGAELIIVNRPLTAKCADCGEEFAIQGYAFSCTHCSGPNIEVVSGRELLVEEVELE